MTIPQAAGPCDAQSSPYVALRTLPYRSTIIHGGFWGQQRAVNRRASLEHGFRMLEKAGNFHNLALAAGTAQGEYSSRLPFLDSDLYKWMEAVAWELGNQPAAALQAVLDQTIDLLEQAQQEDGYLNSYYTVVKPDQRWVELKDGHEMYCAGHLFQAAVALHRTTGATRLLNVALRFADHIDDVFGPGKRRGLCGHPEIETALIELARETGVSRYLRLASYFVEERGHYLLGAGLARSAYYQDHLPVREAHTVEGHAVRQLYLLAGVADLYMETGEKALLDALMRQWRDMVGRKLFVTGGVGSRAVGESFGEPYELPNDTCYCETCAQIASVMWSWRMLLITGQGCFADLMERTLFNGLLSGRSLDGSATRYENPLLRRGLPEVWGSHGNERKEWYPCACCPPNIMRLLSSLGHYVATQTQNGLQMQQYAAVDITADLQHGRVHLRTQTDYPWQGGVMLTVNETPGASWRLSLRVPGWCPNPRLLINGERAPAHVGGNGYVDIERPWQVNDKIELDLPMPPRLTVAHPRVDPTRGCVAIERGPLVYCLESNDLPPGVNVMDVALAREPHAEVIWRDDVLNGVAVIKAHGYEVTPLGWQDHLYRPLGSHTLSARRSIALTAIPYFAWDNRGLSAMRVWIPYE